jgi:hypothetical protein
LPYTDPIGVTPEVIKHLKADFNEASEVDGCKFSSPELEAAG